MSREVPGPELRLGLAEGAVGLGRISQMVPGDIVARVQERAGKVESGHVSIPA